MKLFKFMKKYLTKCQSSKVAKLYTIVLCYCAQIVLCRWYYATYACKNFFEDTHLISDNMIVTNIYYFKPRNDTFIIADLTIIQQKMGYLIHSQQNAFLCFFTVTYSNKMSLFYITKTLFTTVLCRCTLTQVQDFLNRYQYLECKKVSKVKLFCCLQNLL